MPTTIGATPICSIPDFASSFFSMPPRPFALPREAIICLNIPGPTEIPKNFETWRWAKEKRVFNRMNVAPDHRYPGKAVSVDQENKLQTQAANWTACAMIQTFAPTPVAAAAALVMVAVPVTCVAKAIVD